MGSHSFIRLSLLSVCLLNPPSVAAVDMCFSRESESYKENITSTNKEKNQCQLSDQEFLEGHAAPMRENITRIVLANNNIKIGPWGSSLGESIFDFGRSSSRIIKVQLYAGVVVDSLKICYAVDRDVFTTYRAGGPGGDLHEFELLPNEYINSVVGSFGTFYCKTCITKLEFKTNLGKKHGPFGQGGGTEFTIPVMDGRIVGFFGHFTKYIDAIGVYLAR